MALTRWGKRITIVAATVVATTMKGAAMFMSDISLIVRKMRTFADRDVCGTGVNVLATRNMK